jgi:multidrug resistance efflux pump
VSDLPGLSGGHWAVLSLLLSLVVAALATVYWSRVDVTALATGAVVIQGGPRPVIAQVKGTVATLTVRAGQMVVAGQEVLKLDATELEARAQNALEQWRAVQDELQSLDAKSAALYEQAVRALQVKRRLLAARARLKQHGVKDLSSRSARVRKLVAFGVASQDDALSARQAQRSAQEDRLLILQQIAEIDLELRDREENFEEQKEARARRSKEAMASLTEARRLLEMATLRAPVPGRVESLLVATGQVVEEGATLARIVPEGSRTSVVAFASVKDAGFLVPGLNARIEFASLPIGEFGKASARVTRVSHDVATERDVAEVLGEQHAPATIRIELELDAGLQLDQLSPRLRSGERAMVRVNTRQRRVVTMLFDFLRRWLE